MKAMMNCELHGKKASLPKEFLKSVQHVVTLDSPVKPKSLKELNYLHGNIAYYPLNLQVDRAIGYMFVHTHLGGQSPVIIPLLGVTMLIAIVDCFMQ